VASSAKKERLIENKDGEPDESRNSNSKLKKMK
jgi:hypothetical protein